MPEAAFLEGDAFRQGPEQKDPRESAEILEFPSAPDLLKKRKHNEEVTRAIEQYASVFEGVVNRMASVLEIQETRLRDGLNTGTSKAFSHDKEELARVRGELKAVRAVVKAMKG